MAELQELFSVRFPILILESTFFKQLVLFLRGRLFGIATFE